MSKQSLWGNFAEKIVCNELRKQNLLSVSDWIYDATDCAAKFSPTTYQGYSLWAIPCMRLMRKSPWFARRVATVVRWMVADIRYEKGLSNQSHFMGRVVRRNLFWPGNWLLGRYVALFRTHNSKLCIQAHEPALPR